MYVYIYIQRESIKILTGMTEEMQQVIDEAKDVLGFSLLVKMTVLQLGLYYICIRRPVCHLLSPCYLCHESL